MSFRVFRRLETDTDFADDYHGAHGPIAISRFAAPDWLPAQVAFYEACRSAGYPDSPDLNRPHSTGVGPTPMNTLNDMRWSTATGYLAGARHRRNLTITPNCLVQRVLIAGGRAVGVEVECDGRRSTIPGDEVILCGGAVGSTQIMLNSGIGPGDLLKQLGVTVMADLPGVGQNLTDHPTVSILFRTKSEVALDGEALARWPFATPPLGPICATT